MKLTLHSLLAAAFSVAIASTAFGQQDIAGSKDYPGITRMAGYYIRDYQEIAFDSYTFTVTVAGRDQEKTVEGRHLEIRYDRPDEVPEPSALQVMRNYQNAARAAGGQVLYQGEDTTTFRLMRGDKQIWGAVKTSNIPSGMFYVLTLIEMQAMKQEVTMDAAAMASGLKDAGSVAIYGIYFDTAKSDLKPESDAALGEIAKLLKQQPALRVFIVGHTNMVGDPASNVKLSQARALSVVNALATKYQIAATRLTPFGAGPYAPVASNKTEEGRAKNRRVELVETATR